MWDQWRPLLGWISSLSLLDNRNKFNSILYLLKVGRWPKQIMSIGKKKTRKICHFEETRSKNQGFFSKIKFYYNQLEGDSKSRCPVYSLVSNK